MNSGGGSSFSVKSNAFHQQGVRSGNGYVVVTSYPIPFTSSPQSLCSQGSPPPFIRYLVVAGGGGNACYCGGGAGGVLIGDLPIEANNQEIKITVGRGGYSGSCGGGGDSGQDSSLGSIVAIGGGKAAHCQSCQGYTGGSGGGAYSGITGNGTPGQGTKGVGCQGGGAGSNATTDRAGDGVSSDISGQKMYYGGGGGGGGDETVRNGLGQNGPGGGGGTMSPHHSGNPGIVILSYPEIYKMPDNYTLTRGSISKVNGNNVFVFEAGELNIENKVGETTNNFITFKPSCSSRPSSSIPSSSKPSSSVPSSSIPSSSLPSSSRPSSSIPSSSRPTCPSGQPTSKPTNPVRRILLYIFF